MVEVMDVPAGDRRLVRYLMEHAWDRVARRSALVDTTHLPGLLALSDGAVVGVLAYQFADEACEVVVIHASERLAGIGTAMLDRMVEIARSHRGVEPGPEGRTRRAGTTQEQHGGNESRTGDGRPCPQVLWLVTTNDNVDAIRFYQRRGFRLSALRPGAVEEARRDLKAEIPEVGGYGIPMRDELEFVRDV